MKEIRFIPMSSNDSEFIGKSIEEIQEDFFNDYLKNIGKGWYYYGKNGIDAKEGDLLLFQMNNSIIAAANLYETQRFLKPNIDGSTGAFIVDRKSIKTFQPISKEEMIKYIPNFVSFNQVKQKYSIDVVNIEELYKRINYHE